MENNNRELGAQDIVIYMVALYFTKDDSKTKSTSRLLLEVLLPSIQRSPTRTTANVVKPNDGYQHAMACIYELSKSFFSWTPPLNHLRMHGMSMILLIQMR